MTVLLRRGWLAPLFLSIALTACGSDDNTSSTTPTPDSGETPAMTIDRMEKDGTLPQLDRSDSLGGVDADQNGVRDDIQAWVQQLPLTPVQQVAVLQLAAANQQALLVNLDDEVALRQVIASQMAGVKCVVRNEADLLDGENIITALRDRTANTEARAMAYMRYMEALNGYVIKSPDGNGCQND